MKEVTIVAYCDGMEHEGERRRSSIERVVAVDNGRPVTLDLCDQCDVLVETMLRLMENGSTVKGKAKKTAAPAAARPRGGQALPTSIPLEGPHICPECQFESKSRGALGQHLSVKHNKGFRDYVVQEQQAS